MTKVPDFSGIFVAAMSRFHSYLNSASRIIHQYDGSVPLAVFLKQFYAQNKQMGSRDRKSISQLCYQYFRLGKAFLDLAIEDRLVFAAHCFPELNADVLSAITTSARNDSTTDDKPISFPNAITPLEIFPFSDLLSANVDAEKFAMSLLQQPHLFIRVRPGLDQKIIEKLKQNKIHYTQHGNCFQLENNTNVGGLLHPNEWMVIQDRSSQSTAEIIKEYCYYSSSTPLNIWDCCAASGGKSIMIHDLFQGIRLTVSDIRQSIIHNLQSRFRQAGIHQYQAFVADLVSFKGNVPNAPFDLVLADVPCTGSGTWARTPEQLYFFQPEVLQEYSNRQYSIASNASRFLKPGGFMAYITCSVFLEENEKVTAKLVNENGLHLVHQEIISGYQHGADSMFTAILQKPV